MHIKVTQLSSGIPKLGQPNNCKKKNTNIHHQQVYLRKQQNKICAKQLNLLDKEFTNQQRIIASKNPGNQRHGFKRRKRVTKQEEKNRSKSSHKDRTLG